jgi:N6-adenosine-specific RNA methylase IME4
MDADPTWRYETGNDLPYPTRTLEDIKALPVKSIAADDALLWLWTTNAHLRVAVEVVEAWGFDYRTLLTWVKNQMGTGEWLRGQTRTLSLRDPRQAGVPARESHHRTRTSAPGALAEAGGILCAGRGHVSRQKG